MDIFQASSKGDVNKVKRFLEQGVDVNTKDAKGNTSLIFASGEGKADVVKVLLESGADVNVKNKVGNTSLMIAAVRGKTDVIKLLIENGADVNAKNYSERNSLTLSLLSGIGYFAILNTINLLLENGADVNAKDKDGDTGLFGAARSAHPDIIKLLIENGADVNVKNNNGDCPLKEAVARERIDIVKLLLENRADVNAKDNYGYTSLMSASVIGNKDIVKLLLENGAEINAKNEDGDTALDLAENRDIKKLLKDSLGKQDPWKGMTRSDISQLDSIFDKKSVDYSICPICLQYSERIDGCMYMTHDCTKHGKEYHTELYNLYKNNDGFIDWCTICNRIAKGHNHFKLADVNATNPSVIVEPGNPYEDDCTLSSGGGGPMEKLARFRRFREYALELQDDIGKKGKEQAFEELVEEVWNAPLRRESRILKEIGNKKNWNISSSKFPLPTATENIVYPNIPYNGPLPTKITSGRNNTEMSNNVEIIRFVHKQPDGTEQTHGISQDNLVTAIQSGIGGFGGEERSGYCFMYPVCKARLYPQEIKEYFKTDEEIKLYNLYKNNFNQKFRTIRGGGSEDLIQEATDVKCLNPKKGGKRNTRKRRHYRKKTMKKSVKKTIKKTMKKAKKTKSRRL